MPFATKMEVMTSEKSNTPSIQDILRGLDTLRATVENMAIQAEEDRQEAARERCEAEKARQATERERKDWENAMERDRKEWARENKKRIDYLDNLFKGQWGKLMESLVKGDLIRLLRERGININDIAQEREKFFQGKTYEFDIIAIDGGEMVAVEVKTTLNLEDVEQFVQKLKMFKEVFPEYKNKKVYGAVAYLKANRGADRKAIKNGLFAIRATGDSASITNDKDFRPTAF